MILSAITFWVCANEAEKQEVKKTREKNCFIISNYIPKIRQMKSGEIICLVY
jgi:hypothetical protein